MALADRNRMPLYRRVAEELKRSVAAGEWEPDSQLPSEPDLARRYAVSRATVREALRALEQEGVVRSRRGQGTFAARPGAVLHVGLDSLYSMTDAILRQGQTPGATDIRIHVKLLDGPFGGPETVALIERTRLADERPVAVSRDSVPLRCLAPAADWESRVSRGSLFNLLLEVGVDLTMSRTQLRAVEAPDDVAQRLDIRPGSPLLLMTETVFDRGGTPVVNSEDYYRTDRIEVNLIRRR
ncbi:MAG TPA: GntR family transcriptional regulator [Symbiobacteriaceae bacterium]|jgi:GntR family transcriptional regulator